MPGFFLQLGSLITAMENHLAIMRVNGWISLQFYFISLYSRDLRKHYIQLSISFHNTFVKVVLDPFYDLLPRRDNSFLCYETVR